MALTIQTVIDLLLAAHPGEPVPNTVDTLKCGNPLAEVRGIATCFLCTQTVAMRAHAAGCNLILTHEPTFYNHRDDRAALESDPVYRTKLQYLNDHGLAVFRYHDYWHRLSPDGILTGMTKRLGWEPYQTAPGDRFFTLPETSLHALATTMQAALGANTLRIVGDPAMRCRRICLNPGYGSVPKLIEHLNTRDTQVLAIGESPEWEIAEYVRDAVAQSRQKALVVLGHAASEEAGMAYLIDWLRVRLPANTATMPILHLASGSPFTTV